MLPLVIQYDLSFLHRNQTLAKANAREFEILYAILFIISFLPTAVLYREKHIHYFLALNKDHFNFQLK